MFRYDKLFTENIHDLVDDIYIMSKQSSEAEAFFRQNISLLYRYNLSPYTYNEIMNIGSRRFPNIN